MSAYVRVVRSIWTDPEWLDLTSIEKLVYLQLISQPNMSKCGVLPFVPRRWAHMHPDLSTDDLTAALAGLEAKRYVIVDRDTEEILVRTYLRYDEAWKQTNGTRGIQIEAHEIMSKRLLGAVIHEYEQASGSPWNKDSDKGCDKGNDKASDKGSATPLALIPYPSTPSPEPETLIDARNMTNDSLELVIVEETETITFDAFWSMYPRKIGKAKALTKWGRLSKRERQAVMDALPDHIAYWRDSGKEDEFIPHAITWLNQKRWEDQLPEPSQSQGLGPSRAQITIQRMMQDAALRESQDRRVPQRPNLGLER